MGYGETRRHAGEKAMMTRIATCAACTVILSAALPAPAAESPGLGRLFFTPQQRTQLDTARSQKSRATLASEKPEEAAPLPQIVTYSGTVRRSDGKSTAWINGRPVAEGEVKSGVPVVGKIRPDGSVALDVQQTGRGVDLKVGQSIEIISGRVEEPFARRATAPQPEPPAPKADAKDASKSGEKGAAAAKADRPDRKAQRQREDDQLELSRLRAAAEAGPAKPPPAGGAAPAP